MNYNYSPAYSPKTSGSTGSNMYDRWGVEKNLDINITLFEGPTEGKDWTFHMLMTIVHESFIYADLDTKDYRDDGLLNNSNVSDKDKSDAGGLSDHYHHSKVRNEFIKSQWGSTQLFAMPAFEIMYEYSQKNGLNYTKFEVLSYMWAFEGGMQIDPKTGKLNGIIFK